MNHEHYKATCKKRSESAKKRWDANAEEAVQTDANADNTNTKGNTNTNTNSNTNSNENVNVKGNEKQAASAENKAAKEASCEHTHKSPHGEFKNVFLSQEEYTKLKQRAADADKRIDSLSAYMKSSGKTYADHYAQLLNWQIFNKNTSEANQIIKKPPGERREPTFDVSEFTKKALNLKYVPPTDE